MAAIAAAISSRTKWQHGGMFNPYELSDDEEKGCYKSGGRTVVQSIDTDDDSDSSSDEEEWIPIRGLSSAFNKCA